MKTEVEAKFLDVVSEELREKLKQHGAQLIQPEVLMRRKVFDYQDARLEKIGAWIRVRDEGNKITMSYKRLVDRTFQGTKEITLTVDSFDAAGDFLSAAGLDSRSYQETKRETWQLDGCEVTIDTWPWIPTFVELEAETEKEVEAAAAKLGFDWAQAMHGSVETAYQKYYDVTEEEIDHLEEIRFVPVPDWLEIKRKQ